MIDYNWQAKQPRSSGMIYQLVKWFDGLTTEYMMERAAEEDKVRTKRSKRERCREIATDCARVSYLEDRRLCHFVKREGDYTSRINQLVLANSSKCTVEGAVWVLGTLEHGKNYDIHQLKANRRSTREVVGDLSLLSQDVLNYIFDSNDAKLDSCAALESVNVVGEVCEAPEESML